MAFLTQPLPAELLHLLVEGEWVLAAPPRACLLYTSDAADE